MPMNGAKDKPLDEIKLEPLGMMAPADCPPTDPAEDDAPC